MNELAAIVNYNVLLADLARTTGTILELYRVKLSTVADGAGAWPAGAAGAGTAATKPAKGSR